MMGASDHEFVGDAAHINLEIEALHRRTREMPGQTARHGSPANRTRRPGADGEIELGPVESLRQGAERALLAPDLRINYGFTPGWEASLEGKLTHGLTAGVPGTSLVEGDALLKGVLREGSLQEKPGPVSQPNLVFYCQGLMINMGPEQSLMALSRSAGTGGPSISTRKLSLPASSMPIISSTRSSRVRVTGRCDRSPKSFMRAMSACFEPAPPSSGRSGRCKTISQLTLACAARAPMAKPLARSVPDNPNYTR